MTSNILGLRANRQQNDTAAINSDEAAEPQAESHASLQPELAVSSHGVRANVATFRQIGAIENVDLKTNCTLLFIKWYDEKMYVFGKSGWETVCSSKETVTKATKVMKFLEAVLTKDVDGVQSVARLKARPDSGRSVLMLNAWKEFVKQCAERAVSEACRLLGREKGKITVSTISDCIYKQKEKLNAYITVLK